MIKIKNNLINFINLIFHPGAWKSETRRRLFIAFISTTICAWIAHGFIFANEFFSHDSIDFYTLGIHFYTQVGRFFIRFYEFFRGDLSVPWLIGFLYILWMSLAGYILSCLLNLKSDWQIDFHFRRFKRSNVRQSDLFPFGAIDIPKHF